MMSGTFTGSLAVLLVKAGGLFLIAELAARLLRNTPAATRHLIWSAAIGAALLLPLLTLSIPEWQVPLFAPASEVGVGAAGSETGTADSGARSADRPLHAGETVGSPEQIAVTGGEIPVGGAARPWLGDVSWPLAAGWVWSLGVILVCGRVAVGAWGARRLAAAGRPADAAWTRAATTVSARLGLPEAPRLVISAAIDMPMAWGVVRPVVMLPEDAEDWSTERRQLVLTHELAHVRRRDCLTQLVAHLACALYWVNPLTWRAAARMRSEREKACDDLVITSGTPGAEYAKHLLEIARCAHGNRAAYGVAIPMARPSQLEGRLLSILNAAGSARSVGRAWRVAIPIAALMVALPVAALQPWAAPMPVPLAPLALSQAPVPLPKSDAVDSAVGRTHHRGLAVGRAGVRDRRPGPGLRGVRRRGRRRGARERRARFRHPRSFDP